MSYYRSNFRDIDAWKKDGFVFSTPSNHAVKLYDAAVSQIIQYHENQSFGGLEKTIQAMIETDPNFVMGHILKAGLPIVETDLERLPQQKDDYNVVMNLMDKGRLTEHERKHALAYKECFLGNTDKACVIWQDILTDYPTDIYALKLLQESYITLGMYPQLQNTVAGILPSWKPETPLYSYLLGMYAFALEENNRYSEAEKYAIEGLELNPLDCWATHARAHIFEETGRQDEGIKFMSETVDNWNVPSALTGHNFWHWALYHVEKGEYEEALSLFDDEVGRRASSTCLFHLTNAASLLYRLDLLGVDVGDRWNQMLYIYGGSIDTHSWMFVDVHMLMCTIATKQDHLTLRLLDSLRDYVKTKSGTNRQVTREVGIPVCEAFNLADKGHFDQAVEILKPIRYSLHKLGGSNAQRDVLNLFFINAAMTSSRKDHQRLARRLLAERKAMRENSPMTDRLMAKALANHI